MKKKLKILAPLIILWVAVGCVSGKTKSRAKEVAAHYWQEKTYPGKAYDVRVIGVEATDDGFQVKGMVNGESRVGFFNPVTETFSDGYRSLANERNKRIVELEQEVSYWKEKAEKLDRENEKLRMKLESFSE